MRLAVGGAVGAESRWEGGAITTEGSSSASSTRETSGGASSASGGTGGGTGNTGSCTSSLALNLRGGGNVGALLGVANREDGALPLLTLPGKLLVLGSLGADTARKVNVGENAVLLGHGDVDLLVIRGLRSLLLGLLLVVKSTLLGSVVEALVEVGLLLGIGLSGLASSVGLLLDLVQGAVKLVGLILNGLLNSLLEGWAKDLQKKRLGNLEEKLVLRLLEIDVQRLEVNVDLVNLEEMLTVLLGSSGNLHAEREAITRQQDVGNTSVRDGGEAALALDVEADIAEIHLDTSNLDVHGVVVVVGNLLAAPAEVVLTGNFKDIGHEVVALKNKILDNGIELRIGVLNARDGDIGSLLQDSREDDGSQILDKVRLEGRLAVGVVAKILEELLHGSAEGLVVRILIELISDSLGLVNDTVGVTLVLATEQLAAVVVEAVPFLVGGVLEDVTLLKEDPADVFVEGDEPVFEFIVLLGILVDLANGFPETRGRGAVGKTLNESAQVSLGGGEALAGLLAAAGGVLADGLAMLAVVFGESQKSLDSLRVVGVGLALDNHLLETEDDLVLALSGHLLVEVFLGLATVLLVALLNLLLGLRVDVVKLLLKSRLASVFAGSSVGSVSILGVTGSRGGGVGGGISDLLSVLLGIALVETLGLLLQVFLVEVGGLVPGVVLGSLVNLTELFLVGAELASSATSSITSHVPKQDGSILQELTELAIGDEQCAEGAETLKSILSIALSGVFVKRGLDAVNALWVKLGSLPDEVLDQVALVLGENEVLGKTDNLMGVANEALAFLRQLVRRLGESL